MAVGSVCLQVKHYHGNNGIFSAEEYRRDCDEKGQSQSFSGVGAQHQNARAEQAIQTIMYMARTFMVHASLHWTERGSDDLSLWSFTVKHSVWIYNSVPNARSGLTPLELITKERSDYREILRCHVWGCPVYVLEAKLQNDQKLPKWNRRAHLGQFVGFSDEHSSMVANVRHLTTGYISPQFHVIFEDLFETVNRTGVDDQKSSSLFAMDFFSVIENFMLKMNLMKSAILFTNLLPFMKFGLTKQDNARVTRIVSTSAVKMRI